MRWVLYCPNCDFETDVSRLDGESFDDAVERLGAAHDDLDGHEVRGRRARSGRTLG